MAHVYINATWHLSFHSTQAWSLLNGIIHSYLPPTRFKPWRAEPHLEHLHLKFSGTVTHWLLVASYFTDPERMVVCVRLKSATSRIWTQLLASEVSVLPLGHLLTCWRYLAVIVSALLSSAVWNSLPQHLRLRDISQGQFASVLKHGLLSCAYA